VRTGDRVRAGESPIAVFERAVAAPVTGETGSVSDAHPLAPA
jgi:hypothetical protein